VTLVWVGFDDAHSVRLAGGDSCVPIWTRHMNRIDGLIADVDWKRPDDVTQREIDPQSGMLATPYCPQTRSEVFVAGTEPDAVCALHAGSGEPSPYWPEAPVYDDAPARADASPAEAAAERRAAEEQRRAAKQRENSIKRLLKRIFGDG
jgi:membrane carboxypeptidase/penicillin-binding protein